VVQLNVEISLCGCRDKLQLTRGSLQIMTCQKALAESIRTSLQMTICVHDAMLTFGRLTCRDVDRDGVTEPCKKK